MWYRYTSVQECSRLETFLAHNNLLCGCRDRLSQ